MSNKIVIKRQPIIEGCLAQSLLFPGTILTVDPDLKSFDVVVFDVIRIRKTFADRLLEGGFAEVWNQNQTSSG